MRLLYRTDAVFSQFSSISLYFYEKLEFLCVWKGIETRIEGGRIDTEPIVCA